jgi:hypothetical protein
LRAKKAHFGGFAVKRSLPFLLVLVALATTTTGCSLGHPTPATSVTADGAALNGIVSSNQGGDVLYWFEYGTTSAYGTKTPDRTLTFPANHQYTDGSRPVAETITGLQPNTTYHYRICTSPGIQPGSRGCVQQEQTFTTPPAPDGCAGAPNEIAAENCRPGNPASEWDVSGEGDPSIQGFATDISVGQGQRVDFKVDTPATDYRLDVYRMGWYGGDGARRVATVQPSATLPQDQPACLTEAASGLVDCGNWAVSASWTVPADAVSGIYFAKLAREDGQPGASHVVFVVRDDDGGSELLFQTSDTTWQAYNRYGGNSLYAGGPGTNPGRAYKVSYNRPFRTRETEPEDWVFNAEYPMVRWLERNGYDVSYTTGVDSHRSGAEIREHKAFLSVGHDEYWSGLQRDNVQAARDAGVNLAFFSGNEIFWKTRWEPSLDASATPNRTLVSYKETHANAKIDPQSGVWTGTWRDPRPFNPEGPRPENALSGTMFTVNSGTSAIEVPAEEGRLRLWRGTSVAGLPDGATATLAGGTLGYEWDEDLDNGARPPGLVRLSSTTRSGVEKLQDHGSTFAPGTATHHLTLHRDANAGGEDALVFGAGTIQWSWGLDGAHDRGGSTPDGRMQQATVNLLADMGAQPATRQADLAPASPSTDATAPASAITSPAEGATVPRGTAVTIQGSASDAGGGAVGGVEVSVDGGQTWHPAEGRGTWRFSWTPQQEGTATIRSRAVDDSGNLEAPSAGRPVVVGPAAPAACPCSIFAPTDAPADQTAQNDGQPIEVGVKLRTEESGFITGVRFFKGVNNTGTHVGHLWSATGQQLAEATFTAELPSGWQEVRFDTPVAVTANTTYVASYHSSAGFYGFQGGFFATGVDRPPLHALADGADGPNGVYKYGASGFPTSSFNASNYWVDVVFERTAPDDTRPPQVAAVTPADGAVDVAAGTRVTARFDEAMDAASITPATFSLSRGGTPVAADVAYDAATRTATLTPQAPLADATSYTATVQGGASGVKDLAGNALAADRTWTFVTAAPPPPPPGDGPGGPILVAASAGDPFGHYYGEILRAEGLNAFAVRDLSTVTAATLADVSVVILPPAALGDAQAAMLEAWVQGGGNLIAMRPDARLAGLLGIGTPSGTLSDAYLRVDTASGPGAGITGETMQFHGTADRFAASGATAVATLHADAATPTGDAAVTLRDVGGAGGQAAAFAYDLARSVVLTRQGNPAWAGQERDNEQGPIRSDDLFFPDWIDFAKVAIPQADEQQRLLANLITEMNLDRAPLPRFWYLPRGEKAAVVMTGDDHGNGGTAGQFDAFKQASPPGCSVADWECIRSTSYLYTSVPMTDAQAAAYQAEGFELALHVNTGCANFTPASLEADVSAQLGDFATRWPSLTAPRTNRTHCIAWSDWATHPKVELAHGIRLDTNYYYWPGSWIQDRPGMFTGSGFPMRFADTDGSLIDVYQATTQLTDESGQDLPRHIAALLDGALGPQGYFGVFTANMHTDQSNHAGANAIVAAAQARGVPVVTARQMLAWLDGRNASAFRRLSFANGELRFTVDPGAGGRGLEAMVPAQSAGGALAGITRGGQAVSTTARTVKGVAYAVFPAEAGDYVATYQGDTTAPAISGRAVTARADGTASVTWQTDEASTSRVTYGTSPGALTGEASDPARATSHSVELTGLQPGATYHFRVHSTDAAGNEATSPAAADPPDTFAVPLTAEQTIADDTVADFAAGTPGPNTFVGATGAADDGEVVLRPAVGEEFGGASLPADWSATPWGAGGTATVGAGALSIDGARAGTAATFAPGRTLEFVGAFAAAPFQHLGFGEGYEGAPWAMFSTRGGDGLYARTNGAAQQETQVAGVTLTDPHRYRISWTATGVEYAVDGASVATHPIAIGSPMRPLGSDFNVGGGVATWHWLRLSPYAAAGTFASRVLDSGQAGSDWTAVQPANATPAGTQLGIETRSGDTASPDATWSAWQPLGGLGSIASPDARYLQYRVALSTSDDTRTPVLEGVTVRFRPPAGP